MQGFTVKATSLSVQLASVHVRAGEGRLYRETPIGLTKAKAPKGRGAAAVLRAS